MANVNETIQKAFVEEEGGNYIAGIAILEKAMQDFLDYKEDILYEMSLMYFRQEEYYSALIGLIEVYRITKNQDVCKFILDAYVKPNEIELRNIYQHNLELINRFEYFYSEKVLDFFEITERLVWVDQIRIIYYNGSQFIEKSTLPESRNKIQTKNTIISELLNKERIIEYIDALNTSGPGEDLIVLYLYYTKEVWSVMMQMQGLDELFQTENVVILIGEGMIRDFFTDEQIPLPKVLLQSQSADIYPLVMEISNEKWKHIKELEAVQKEYYSNRSSDIIENIKSGKPRILFITSSKTTVLQYHAKNMKAAADVLNLETELLIDTKKIQTFTYEHAISEIVKFKPDIIFLMDHFRFEADLKTDQVVYITWVQDPMHNIMSKDTPAKLSDRDIILNHFTTWRKFFEVGYDDSRIIEAPIPANQYIYRPYCMTAEEKARYSCDICFVCHSADVMKYIRDFSISFAGGAIKDAIEELCMTYYQMVLQEEKIIYSEEGFREYIDNFFQNTYLTNLKEISPDLLESLTSEFYVEFNQKVFRQALIDWILEAGYANVKLWGNGWLEEEKYTPYAMGPAENGETLSKIYQSSKIVIGNNIMTTAAARVWESMLSGAFYMSNYIPPENDITDIRKILDTEDYIMFYNKKDLIEKIKYYLNHEDEREIMIQRGRKKALEKMTFEKLMDKLRNRLMEIF